MDTNINPDKRLTADLLDFLGNSPLSFQAVANVAARLEQNGFIALDRADKWNLARGGRYYVTVNGTALFAFIVADSEAPAPFHIIAAHSDSPGFRIKPHPFMLGDGGIARINTEVYGGPILYTWFDRPLSVAGRIAVRGDDPLSPVIRNVRCRRPLLTIPHLAIHYNRSVNDGNPLSRQRDMLPVTGYVSDALEADRLLFEALGVAPDEVVDYDLGLYDTTAPCTLGIRDEFISAGRIDDLSMVHAGLTALLDAAGDTSSASRVLAVFDNEETGSGTKQGAGSPVLAQLMERINMAIGGNSEDYLRSVARSFMISADNAHGVHPNYVDKQDPTNHPVLGGGPVIKFNANCKYMTDADSAAVFAALCERAGVPCQRFVNHSDVAGGSTLGNILTSQVPLRGVDMGAAMWAMHSCRETSSALDHAYTVSAFTEFYRF